MSDPNDPVLTVSLPMSSWTTVVTILGGAPHNVICGIFASLEQQLRPQLATAPSRESLSENPAELPVILN
jgi:hypothetical protein